MLADYRRIADRKKPDGLPALARERAIVTVIIRPHTMSAI